MALAKRHAQGLHRDASTVAQSDVLPANDKASRKIDPAHWRRLSACLDEALDLDAEPRASWLARLRQTEPPLADEVAALLAEHDAALAEVFLDGVVAMPAPTGPAATLQGRCLGAYTLQEPIGQGGMGSVWRALRSDGQYNAFVAIKLLNTALIGAAGLARFKREGSILARLQHPHIAHLLDAGVSDDGQPYLVLELVEGEPIDAYCARCRLGVEQRLVLFLDALGAVAHAHTHLVVHRDLKPSNVLVMSDGQVKLLDFGIAKLLEEDDGAGALTQEGTRALTPQYAAPEQLQGGPITTATDVYALGVMLYQLLGGRHPTGGDHGSAAQIIRATLDTEPARMSDLSATNPRTSIADVENIAGERATSVAGLQRQLRGDLDNIVARALKKTPAERYATADALADDLRRHLNDQPVSAHADALGYRIAKFVRRHRGAVAAAALFVVSLSTLTGLATWQWRDARAQQRQAEFASRHALAAAAFSGLWLSSFSATLDAAGQRASLDTARRILASQNFDADPVIQAYLKLQLAARYGESGATDVYLVLTREAQAVIARTDNWVDRAFVANSIANALKNQGRVREAMAEIEQSRALLARRPDAAAMAESLQFESLLASAAGQHERALAAAREGHQGLERAGLKATPLYRILRAAEARAHASAGRALQAVELDRKSVAELEAQGDRESPTYRRAVVRLAEQRLAAGDLAAAREALRAPWAGEARNAEALWRLRARVDEIEGRPSQAWQAYRRVADRARLGHAALDEFEALADATRVRLQLDLAAALAEELPRTRALGTRLVALGADEASALALVEARASLAQGRSAEALATLDGLPKNDAEPLAPAILALAGEAELAAGRPRQACALATLWRRVALVRGGEKSLTVMQADLALARCKGALGEPAAAQAHAAAAALRAAALLDPGHPWVREALQLAGAPSGARVPDAGHRK